MHPDVDKPTSVTKNPTQHKNFAGCPRMVKKPERVVFRLPQISHPAGLRWAFPLPNNFNPLPHGRVALTNIFYANFHSMYLKDALKICGNFRQLADDSYTSNPRGWTEKACRLCVAVSIMVDVYLSHDLSTVDRDSLPTHCSDTASCYFN